MLVGRLLAGVFGAVVAATATLAQTPPAAAPQTPPQAAPATRNAPPTPRPAAPLQTPGRDAPVRGTHGAWQVLCEHLPGAQNEMCALFQTVEAADRPNTGLAVFAFRTADQRTNVLRVIAPLGVLLTGGLGLRIDEQNIGSTDFVRCWPTGCIAEARLSEELLGRLRGGRTATFILFMTPEEGVGIPISLEGFNQGFEALVAMGQTSTPAPALAPAPAPAAPAPTPAPQPSTQPPRR